MVRRVCQSLKYAIYHKNIIDCFRKNNFTLTYSFNLKLINKRMSILFMSDVDG